MSLPQLFNFDTSRFNKILFVGFLLIVLGTINLASAADQSRQVYSHMVRLGLFVVPFLYLSFFFKPKHLYHYAYTFYFLTVFSLVLVVLFGQMGGGSQRWLELFGFRLQPSEIAKLAVAIITARFFFDKRSTHFFRLRDLGLVFLLNGIIFGLIFVQPDLGTGGLCLMICFAQLICMPLYFPSVLIFMTQTFIVATAGWAFLLKPYQKLRILNLLNPNFDPTGSGYNSIQSLIAIGSGGIFGKGYFEGTQSNLQFLPARHTDFVFSVLAEEWGVLGSWLVLLLFAYFIFLILDTARFAVDLFQSLLCVGIAAIFFFEAVINVAMVLGLFPVVGMPLPFFSYGGSSLLVMMLSFGLVLSVERNAMQNRRSSPTKTLINFNPVRGF